MNTTLLTALSSAASAASLIVPETVWPLDGEVSETLGAAFGGGVGAGGVVVVVEVVLFLIVTLTCAVLDAPFASYATAFSVYAPSFSCLVSKLQFQGEL